MPNSLIFSSLLLVSSLLASAAHATPVVVCQTVPGKVPGVKWVFSGGSQGEEIVAHITVRPIKAPPYHHTIVLHTLPTKALIFRSNDLGVTVRQYSNNGEVLQVESIIPWVPSAKGLLDGVPCDHDLSLLL